MRKDSNVIYPKFRRAEPIPDKMKGNGGDGPMDPKSPVIHAELDAVTNKIDGRFNTTDEKLNSINKSVDSLSKDVRELRGWIIGGIGVGVLLGIISIAVSLLLKFAI